MDYVIVNYGLNQIYTVHKKTFEQTVEAIFSKSTNFKLGKNLKIIVNSTNTNVSIEFDFYSYQSQNEFSQRLTNLIEKIKDAVKLLIRVDVENISMNYLGKLNRKK
ncbi:MMB_0454 family protein [Mesomycoplasma lagogenitalium]|uniref:Asp23/Gls24 family envelope stress response protein n=1 Tax=Mesomycoplasma lagogenitalium TaxID=171286 RepID=A0ABY8LXM0_9BACT|nr:hypothetical protein [Mesomycoplasma lagogenitalium]WGI36882.1 hypothetical protein QEG99_01185 [Mesomycoplasma lagogenitalium]